MNRETIRVSVRELAETSQQSGDLNLDTFSTSARAQTGIRIHQKIQKSRPQEYKKEVAVAKTITTEKLQIKISGRIDGVFQYADKTIIDEIKTTTRDFKSLEIKEDQIHWAQAKLYAFIYAEIYEMEKIEVQLTYFQIDAKEQKEFRKSFSFRELSSFFQQTTSAFIDRMERQYDWKISRNKSIKKLDFPFASYRKGQRKMAVAIYNTVRNSKQLIVQAPTGIGKSLAALFPAVKALAENLTQKIFYLTPKTTGKEAAEKALRLMYEKGLKLKFITLTAKDKICFNPDKACNGEECEFARAFYDKIDKAEEDIFDEQEISRSKIETYARKHRVCPFEFSLNISLQADCVICDYNYAFDPRTYLRRFFEDSSIIRNNRYVFLIDEAHNLVERARNMFSAELFKQDFLDLRRAINKRVISIWKAAGKINMYLLQYRKKCENRTDNLTEKDLPKNIFPLLDKFLSASEKWLVNNWQTDFRQLLLETYFSVLRFKRISEIFSDDFLTCYEKTGNNLRLKLFCLDPARLLNEALKRANSTIFFSATLSPSYYFRNILGCADDVNILKLPSPFPRENFQVFLENRISTKFKDRGKTVDRLYRTIRDFIEQKKGNYLIFFPSYNYLEAFKEVLIVEELPFDLMWQQRNMSEAERDEFLNSFEHDHNRTFVGLAVLGGVFAEGIDLVGNRLDAAIIVGVGLPKINPEGNLIREYFQKEGKGFEYAYLYPGMIKILQAAGRVVRTKFDKGRLLLIDDRYSSYRYKKLLPKEWGIRRL